MSKVDLPKEWIYTSLEEVAEWGAGGTPSRRTASYYNGDIPWIKTGDLGPKILTEVNEFITEEAVANSSAKFFPKGAVAIAMYGATIGKTSILGIDATTNQACAVGNPIPGLTTTNFLYYFLTNEKERFVAKGKGGAQPNISQTLIKKHEIALPPLAEQKEIANRLDDLLAQVDTAKERLDNIPNIIKKFRQSVLAAAVSGKLTEDWRNGDDMTWRESKIKDFTTKIGSGSTPRGGSNSYKETGIPLVRSMNIHFNYIRYDKLVFIDDTQADKLKNVMVKQDDVLLNITGASIGRVNIATERLNGARVNQHVSIIRCIKDIVLPKFLNIYLASPKSQKWINNENYGATRQALTKGMIENYKVSLPKIEEQTEIVKRVETLFAYAEQIESRVNEARKRVDNLTQSILAKAFRGDLTADWRASNPDLISGKNSAESLLKKIQAERKQVKAKSKPKKKARLKKKEKVTVEYLGTINKLEKTMNIEEVIPISEALKKAEISLTGQELLKKAGYPNDASVELIEQFFLDIREELEAGTIAKIRKKNEDVFIDLRQKI